MKEPIVQKRRAANDGGESDIPSARTQCFPKSSLDFVLNAARKPCVTAMMASVSYVSCWSHCPEQALTCNVQHIGMKGPVEK